KVYKKFTERLVERARGLRVGDGLDERTDVGPVISASAVHKILGYIETGQREDRAKLACGGNRLGKGEYARGYFVEPTGFTIGAEVHLPFGGTKATGNGHREAGTQVLDIFTEWKSVYVDYSGKLQRAQIDEVNFE